LDDWMQKREKPFSSRPNPWSSPSKQQKPAHSNPAVAPHPTPVTSHPKLAPEPTRPPEPVKTNPTPAVEPVEPARSPDRLSHDQDPHDTIYIDQDGNLHSKDDS
jgi:hypothetical protein